MTHAVSFHHWVKNKHLTVKLPGRGGNLLERPHFVLEKKKKIEFGRPIKNNESSFSCPCPWPEGSKALSWPLMMLSLVTNFLQVCAQRELGFDPCPSTPHYAIIWKKICLLTINLVLKMDFLSFHYWLIRIFNMRLMSSWQSHILHPEIDTSWICKCELVLMNDFSLLISTHNFVEAWPLDFTQIWLAESDSADILKFKQNRLASVCHVLICRLIIDLAEWLHFGPVVIRQNEQSGPVYIR